VRHATSRSSPPRSTQARDKDCGYLSEVIKTCDGGLGFLVTVEEQHVDLAHHRRLNDL